MWLSLGQSASSGGDYSLGNKGSRPVSHRTAPFFPQARVKLSECGLFPRENGRATCEGTARDRILRKRDNYL